MRRGLGTPASSCGGRRRRPGRRCGQSESWRSFCSPHRGGRQAKTVMDGAYGPGRRRGLRSAGVGDGQAGPGRLFSAAGHCTLRRPAAGGGPCERRPKEPACPKRKLPGGFPGGKAALRARRVSGELDDGASVLTPCRPSISWDGRRRHGSGHCRPGFPCRSCHDCVCGRKGRPFRPAPRMTGRSLPPDTRPSRSPRTRSARSSTSRGTPASRTTWMPQLRPALVSPARVLAGALRAAHASASVDRRVHRHSLP